MVGASESAPRMAYRPELDGLRGLAVMLVFLQHAQIAGFIRAGWIGVTMFFTLSGFLITSLLLAERRSTGKIDLGRFYWRRALRLIPALVLLLLVVGLLGAAFSRDLGLQLLATLGYVSNWANIAGLDMWVLGHTWSLGIEEQFYIVWPLILLVVRTPRRLALLCVVGIAAAIVLRVVLFGPDPDAQNRWSHGLDTRADALLIGCLLALAGWRAARWLGWVGAAGIAVSLVLFQSTAGLAFAGLALAGVSTALLIAAHAGLTWRPLVALGGISYGVYLWHFPVIELTRSLSASVSGPALVFLWAVTTLLLAFLSRRLVELPLLRFRDAPIAVSMRRRRLT